MGKNKTFSQKVGGKGQTLKLKHHIKGGPVNGYQVCDPEGELIKTFEYVQDAVDLRNKLNAV